ncbi:MAG: N-acetylneuraminate synthase family protein [Methanoregula sp.]|nr:N-acetylneuraminate synthase family protein [Methanoregula sp.]
MIIGKRNTDEQVLIIAEIGNNHEGDYDTAVRLVHAAADCGVDGVKFQTYKTEKFVSFSDSARFERLKSFELTYSQFSRLSELAHSLGILFISTPLDLESAKFLNSIVDAYKIASGDNNFYPLFNEVAKTGKPVIISTGASDPERIDNAVSFLEKGWKRYDKKNALAILHCVSCYPTPENQINLQILYNFANRYQHTIGYSDHTTGIEASVLAVACGARIIEKHFTLDKAFSSFRDHQLSADPKDMSELVQRIRAASVMLGSKYKKIQPCETELSIAIRRSIVAGRDMETGHQIGFSDLIWVRPGDGLAPGNEYKLIGKRLKYAVNLGRPLHESDVE